ncbi:MAG: Trk system potassium transport protein TrkA [Bacteroidia bacterium]|nr:MAG: Trk system potassium transport protein TrkA [Bacteroidia bacterium]
MKIIIMGVGEVGFHLARLLSVEGNDIVVIDRDADRLARVREGLDVMTIQGNGAKSSVLREAGVANADMMIAVTSLDTVNFTACMLAGSLGAKKKIVRLDEPEEVLGDDVAKKAQELGFDLVISPDVLAAREIVRLIRRSAATDVLEFADGRIQILGLKLDMDSPLINKKLKDVTNAYSELPFRAVAISRGIRTIIPTGEDVFRRGDQIFVISKSEAVPEMIKLSGKESVRFENIMILGGKGIGLRVAEELQDDVSIKLIESSKGEAMKLANVLDKAMVIRGEGKDLDLLAAEGIMDMDAYIAVTKDEEDNIISCLMAKHLGVKKTIAHVEKLDYIPLANTIGIDALVNKKLSAANEILKFVRKGQIVSVATLHGVDAEVIEMVAQKGSAVTKKPLRDLKFPEGAIIGCVIHNGMVTIPVGSSRILPQDRVVVFTLPTALRDVEKFFS